MVLEGGGSAESCAELSSPMLLTPIPKPCWPTMQSLKACFLTTAHLPNRVLARQQHNAQHSPSFQSLPHSCHSHPCGLPTHAGPAHLFNLLLAGRRRSARQRRGATLQAHQPVRGAQHSQPLGVVLKLQGALGVREVDDLHLQAGMGAVRVGQPTDQPMRLSMRAQDNSDTCAAGAGQQHGCKHFAT